MARPAARRVLKNIGALSAAQAASCVLPLVVLPYTAVVLGPEKFGLMALIQAGVGYCSLVTDYGFSWSATRQVSLARGKPNELAEILVNVWAVKALLMLACLGVSLAALLWLKPLRPVAAGYLCGFLIVAGNVLNPDWFFQGMEQMKWITVANVVPKLALTPLIFLFVRQPADYVYLLLIQSATGVVSGAIGAALIPKCLGARIPRPRLVIIVAQFRNGLPSFLSAASISFYTSANVLILGLFASTTVVGYYSASQKVVTAIQSLWTPVSRSLYPYFCGAFHANGRLAGRRLKQLAVAVCILTLSGAALGSILAPRLAPAYLGGRFGGAVPIIQILVFSAWAVSTSNVLGLHGLLAAGFHGEFLRTVSIAGAVSLPLASLAAWLGGPIGLALCTVAVEAFIVLFQYVMLRQRRIL